MSPFSRYFHQLRMTYAIRQVELAALMNYEQSYISAMESGKKGPPTTDFIERLIEALSLTQDEQNELHDAVTASQRKLIIPADIHEDMYWLLQDLRCHLSTLHPAEINLIRGVIKLRGKTAHQATSPMLRLRRRQEADKM